MVNAIKKTDYRHFVVWGILALLFVVMCLFNPQVFLKLWEALSTFGRTFLNMFTSDLQSGNPIYNPLRGEGTVIPDDIREIVYDFKLWCIGIVNWETVGGYLFAARLVLSAIARRLVFVPYLITFILIYDVIYFWPQKKNKAKRIGPTKSYMRFQKMDDRFFVPIRIWLHDFVWFVYEKASYGLTLAVVIVLFGVDGFSIIANLIAWYLSFTVTYSVSGIETLLINVVFDFVGLLRKLSWPILIALGLIVFDRIRKKDAKDMEKEMQKANEELTAGLGSSTLLVAPQGLGKTTMEGSILRDGEKLTREICGGIVEKYNLMYPDFPFRNLHEYIREAVFSHRLVNRAQIKNDVGNHVLSFLNHDPSETLFGYKKTCKTDVYVGNGSVGLLEALTNYAQAFFLFDCPKPLAVANISFSFDYEVDEGFYKLYDFDYIQRNYFDVMKNVKRYAIITRFDARRLGTKKNPADDTWWYYQDGGMEAVDEVSGERGNAITNQDKDKADSNANQKNDLYVDSVKIQRHINYIDGNPIIHLVSTTQRLGSVESNFWESCEDIIRIMKREKVVNLLAGSWIEDAVCGWITKKWSQFWKKDMNVHNYETLTKHLFTRFAAKFFLYYLRNLNIYGVEEVIYRRESGGTAEETGIKTQGVYYFIWLKVRANMFYSAAFEDAFEKQRLKATKGMYDAQTFASYKGTLEEFDSEGSYWVDTLLSHARKNAAAAQINYKKI